MGASERRRHSRIPYFTEAWLEGLDVARVTCRLGDLGIGGAFVDARTSLPPGTRVRLRFRLSGREVTTVAEIRYVAPGIGMGVQFVDLAETDRSLISAAIGGER